LSADHPPERDEIIKIPIIQTQSKTTATTAKMIYVFRLDFPGSVTFVGITGWTGACVNGGGCGGRTG